MLEIRQCPPGNIKKLSREVGTSLSDYRNKTTKDFVTTLSILLPIIYNSIILILPKVIVVDSHFMESQNLRITGAIFCFYSKSFHFC